MRFLVSLVHLCVLFVTIPVEGIVEHIKSTAIIKKMLRGRKLQDVDDIVPSFEPTPEPTAEPITESITSHIPTASIISKTNSTSLMPTVSISKPSTHAPIESPTLTPQSSNKPSALPLEATISHSQAPITNLPVTEAPITEFPTSSLPIQESSSTIPSLSLSDHPTTKPSRMPHSKRPSTLPTVMPVVISSESPSLDPSQELSADPTETSKTTDDVSDDSADGGGDGGNNVSTLRPTPTPTTKSPHKPKHPRQPSIAPIKNKEPTHSDDFSFPTPPTSPVTEPVDSPVYIPADSPTSTGNAESPPADGKDPAKQPVVIPHKKTQVPTTMDFDTPPDGQDGSVDGNLDGSIDGEDNPDDSQSMYFFVGVLIALFAAIFLCR